MFNNLLKCEWEPSQSPDDPWWSHPRWWRMLWQGSQFRVMPHVNSRTAWPCYLCACVDWSAHAWASPLNTDPGHPALSFQAFSISLSTASFVHFFFDKTLGSGFTMFWVFFLQGKCSAKTNTPCRHFLPESHYPRCFQSGYTKKGAFQELANTAEALKHISYLWAAGKRVTKNPSVICRIPSNLGRTVVV